MESTTQIFLLINVTSESDYVKGESRVEGYAKRIQIDSFDFGMKAKEQSVRDTGTQAVTGNLDFDAVSVSKYFDRASVRLMQLVKERTEFIEARITVDQQLEERSGERAQNAIIVFHLYNGHVASLKLQTSESDKGASMKENLTLTFRNFAVEYYFKSDRTRDYRDDYVGFETAYEDQE